MPKPYDLLDQRRGLFVRAEELVLSAKKTGKDLDGADLVQFNGCIATMRQIDEQLDKIEACGSKLERDHSFPSSPQSESRTPRVIMPGNRGEFRHGTMSEVVKHASAEERAQIVALASFLSGDIRAAADLTPSGDGGFIIPSIVQQTMERNYLQFAPVQSVARLWATETGEPATFPVLSDSESAVQLAAAAATGADATVSGDTPPTALTGPKLGSYKVSSKPVFIPRETIADGAIDIVTEVLGALLARIIRFENLKYTSGNGTSEAEGFLTNCSHLAAGAVALDLDIALDLAYNVSALYRPNGVYMMSDTTAKYLRKLKTGITGDKRQLWADADATKGTPATLHGYPVVINNDMDSVATDGTFAAKVPLAFGDFKRFVVRQAEMGLGYIYRYSVPAKDGSAVIMFRRSDSALLVSTAICKLTVS